MANLAPAHAAFGLTNPSNGNLFPGYLNGSPALVPSRRKGRRDKPYRALRIPFLTTSPSTTTIPSLPSNASIPKPQPILFSTANTYPPGSGKAAKKARRRARKRAARAQARAEAEEERRLAREKGERDEVRLAAEKKARDRALYEKVKRENAKRIEVEHEGGIGGREKVKTRSVVKKMKEEMEARRMAGKELVKNREIVEMRAKGEVKKGGEGKGVKRKAGDEVEEDEREGGPPSKKVRGDEYVPLPDEDGYAEAIARAKAGKGKAGAGGVDGGSQGTKRRRGDDEEDKGQDDVTDLAARSAKKVKFVKQEDDDEEDDDNEVDDDLDSLFNGSVASDHAYDPISNLPDLGAEQPNLASLPEEVLERIVEHCDPLTRTFLGLANKRLARLAVAGSAGFPCIRDRYGGDLERHRFMQMLEPWMNRAYTETPAPITVAQQTAREQLKERRLCYICRKYQPIRGKKCQYWKNCPKQQDMPVDPASQAARRAELERRRTAAANNNARAVHFRAPLPKIKKLKPRAQTFVWQDEDWSTLSVGLCKSRERIADVKSICPKCTLTVHTVHLGWPPETPIVRWLNEGNPAGGRGSMGHMPLSGDLGEEDITDDDDDDGDDVEVGEASGA